MRKLLLLFLGVLTISFSCKAQYNVSPVQCKGEVPLELKRYASEMLDDVTEKNSTSKKQKINFEYNANLGLHRLFNSGDIIYGTELNDYINKIGSKILKANSLNPEIKFYILRSANLNAFASDQGIIFTTIGLLAFAETEEEVAFILSHEIAHYVKKHNFEIFKKADDMGLEKKPRKKNGTEIDQIFNDEKIISDYSKEKELEADSIGFQFYINTGYAYQGALKAINILKYPLKITQAGEWSPEYLTGISLSLPQEYFKEKAIFTSSTRESEDKDDEELSTHPTWEIRYEKIEAAIERLSPDKKVEKFVTSANFVRITQQAQLECLFIYLSNAEYILAQYQVFVLEKKYGPNPQLEELKLISLFNMYETRNKKEFKFKLAKKDSVSMIENQPFIKMVSFFNSISKVEWQLLQANILQDMDPKKSSFVLNWIAPFIAKKMIDYKREEDTKKILQDTLQNSITIKKIRLIYAYGLEDEINVNKEEPKQFSKSFHTINNFGVKKKDRVYDLDTIYILTPEISNYKIKNGKFYNNLVLDEELKVKVFNIFMEDGKKQGIVYIPINYMDKENISSTTWNQYNNFNYYIKESFRINNSKYKTRIAPIYLNYLQNINEHQEKKVLLLNLININSKNLTGMERQYFRKAVIYQALLFDYGQGRLHFMELEWFKHKLRNDFLYALIHDTNFEIKLSLNE